MQNYSNNSLEDETPQNEAMKVDGISPEAMPDKIAESEIVDPEIAETESADAEIVDDAEDENDTGAVDFSPHQSSGLLTAKTLFRQAMKVSAGDPMRQWKGFSYEDCLRRECEATLEIPIDKNDLAALANVYLLRRFNPGFFQCTAIDTVLYNYVAACIMKAVNK